MMILLQLTLQFSLNKKQKTGTLFKVDFKKAYDSVLWSFLEYMMEQLGFGANMIKWIM